MATARSMLAQTVELATGAKIPQIQLGLYMMSGSEASQSVRWAMDAGYRGIDCAQMYDNEAEAGAAVRDYISSGGGGGGQRGGTAAEEAISRDAVFFTTKLARCTPSSATARKSIRDSVDRCGLGHVDLMLLHSPHGGPEARLASWRAVEDAIEAGEVKMGGVSNFGVRHIEELMASNPRHRPVVNQIEVHPFNTQVAIREACKRHGIVIQAYAPLVRGMRMKHPVLVQLSAKYGCTVAQLLVRWSLQHGFVTLPKSIKRERIIENADVGGFEISSEDMEKMDGLDEKLVTDWDPTNVA